MYINYYFFFDYLIIERGWLRILESVFIVESYQCIVYYFVMEVKDDVFVLF